MNYKEFRCGNYVEHDGRVFQIDSIAEVFPTLNTDEFGIGVVDWNNISPIPLTEEWLINFGAVKLETEHTPNYFLLQFEIEDLTSIPELNSDFIVRKRYNNENSLFICEIKYAHQLQNLFFSLTGNELTPNKPLS